MYLRTNFVTRIVADWWGSFSADLNLQHWPPDLQCLQATHHWEPVRHSLQGLVHGQSHHSRADGQELTGHGVGIYESLVLFKRYFSGSFFLKKYILYTWLLFHSPLLAHQMPGSMTFRCVGTRSRTWQRGEIGVSYDYPKTSLNQH